MKIQSFSISSVAMDTVTLFGMIFSIFWFAGKRDGVICLLGVSLEVLGIVEVVVVKTWDLVSVLETMVLEMKEGAVVVTDRVGGRMSFLDDVEMKMSLLG